MPHPPPSYEAATRKNLLLVLAKHPLFYLDGGFLEVACRVCRKWNQELNRFLWHDPIATLSRQRRPFRKSHNDFQSHF